MLLIELLGEQPTLLCGQVPTNSKGGGVHHLRADRDASEKPAMGVDAEERDAVESLVRLLAPIVPAEVRG